MPSRTEQIEKQIQQLQEELAQLKARPPEPDTMYSPAIVVFDLVSKTGKPGRNPVRTYMAFKYRSLYYVAGLEAPFPNGVPWSGLLDWIQQEGGTELTVATTMEHYATVTAAEANGAATPKTKPRTRAGRARPQERRGDQ